MRLAVALTLAVAAGVSGWAAHPPVAAGPLILLVVPLLLAAVERVDLASVPHRATPGGARVASALEGLDRPITGLRPNKLPAAVGLLAGLVTFLPMLAWLILPAGVIGWVLVSLIQACWYGLVAYLLRRWVHSAWVVLAVPVLWTGMEAWRAAVPLGGFGWGSLAYAHVHGSPLLPIARVVGASGLTFLTALLGALAYDSVRRARVARAGGRSAAGAGVRALPPLTAVVLLGLVVTIVSPDAPPASGRAVDLLAVQGNDLVDFTSSRGAEDSAIAGRLLAETRAAVDAGGPPDLTIWPENSIDVDPFTSTGAFLRRYVTEGAGAVGGQLLFGTNLDGPDPDLTFRNAAVLVDRTGEPVDRYVKRRYVPFGEYVPWRAVLGNLPPLRQVPRDGVAGAGPQTIDAAHARLAVVICFETLFSDVLRTNVLADGAGLVVALTNDASFGRSWESDQHIAQSQLRAVETGRWVVHAAISGASALVDPDGRIQYRTGLFERATIRADVPVIEASTPFLAAGDVIGFLARWGALALVLAEVALRLRGRRHDDLPSHSGQVVEVAEVGADGVPASRVDLVVEAGRSEEGL